MCRIMISEYSLRNVIHKRQSRYAVSVGKIVFYLYLSLTKIMLQKVRCFIDVSNRYLIVK